MVSTIVGDWPRINAERRLAAPWVVDAHSARTWVELDERVNRLAHALAGIDGHRPGRRFGILADNRTEHLELMFAASRLGCIHTALNTRHSAEEMVRQIDDSGLDVLLVGDTYVATSGLLRAARPAIRFIGLAGAELDQRYEDLIAAAPAEPVESHGDAEAVYSLVYTSGTTGEPKGLMVSSRNETVYGRSVEWTVELESRDRVLNIAPLFHRGGQFFSMMCAQYGVPLVLGKSPDPTSLLEDIRREQVTVLLVVPTILTGIVEALEADPDRLADFASVRQVMCGSAPLSPALARRLLELTGVKLCQGAGMSEGGLAMSLTSEDYVTALADERFAHRMASVGRPNPTFRVAVVDADDKVVADDVVGEFVYQGDAFVQGYWGRPEASARAWRGGWFHSGDLGRRDADGYLYYVDRLFGRIKTGAETVYAREVEQALEGHAGVAELAVVGVPDTYWGEAVTAIVVPRAPAIGEAERAEMEAGLRSYGRENGLAGYKLPKRVELVEALPKTSTNKVAYGALKALATALSSQQTVASDG